MKFVRPTAFLLFLLALFHAAAAQSVNSWIEVSPPDKLISISMPNQPNTKDQQTRYGQISANGKSYESSADGASYAVWSLVNANYLSDQPVDDYLDACAELIWEGLLKTARDKLPDDRRVRAAMTYVKELPAKPLRGREYAIALGELTGTTQFYVAESRIYVLLAMNSPGGAWARERFFESFKISPGLPRPNTLYGDPIIGGNKTAKSDSSDMNQVFSGRDVTQKARVLEKAEPTYTESARKFGVEGTVVLRAVFSREGEVTNLYVVRRLPHGLTQQAIKAARAIRFTPAMKDGQSVSMYMQLEYNFNLY